MGLSGFPLILEKVQVPPTTPQRGVSAPLGGWIAEVGRPPTSFMGWGTLWHMGVLPFCADLFCFTILTWPQKDVNAG